MQRKAIAGAVMAGLMSLALVAGCNTTAATGESPVSTTQETASDGNVLVQPSDFKFDAESGEFSFTANDENVGYYYVRVYALRDGEEVGDMIASSDRISGGSTGEMSGTVDLSSLAYGDYHVNLVTYAAAGTDFETPEDITLTIQSGVGGKLERPEMLVMASGNQVELILDWWTLCDYNTLQYMPEVKFTFYSDAECTEVVREETVDTYELLAGMKKNPPGTGYIWGEARDASVVRWHTSNGSIISMFGGSTEGIEPVSFGFVNDIYAYELDPGVYYVTAQAVSSYDYVEDSEPSTAVEFTVTDAEPSSEVTEGMTELYVDPDYDGSSITAAPDGQANRVDLASAQTTTRELVDAE